jgi:hypothetical protein
MNNNSSAMRGGAIILVILIMISLSIFGVLAMVSAHSDYILASKGSAWLTRYYQMDAMGQEQLQIASDALSTGSAEDLGPLGWIVEEDRAILTLQMPAGEFQTGNLHLKQAEQTLKITIALVPEGFKVIGWAQIQESPEYHDPGDDVWSGEDFFFE